MAAADSEIGTLPPRFIIQNLIFWWDGCFHENIMLYIYNPLIYVCLTDTPPNNSLYMFRVGTDEQKMGMNSYNQVFVNGTEFNVLIISGNTRLHFSRLCIPPHYFY